jgi:hypothetical protein
VVLEGDARPSALEPESAGEDEAHDSLTLAAPRFEQFEHAVVVHA